ncbi:TetR/AcrR family transcriptional regulator [Williamsia sp. SKLECPSW1]
MARKAKPLEPDRDLALVVAAGRRFAALGYEGTSLNQVLAEAGWQKSSFYHHFADKSRLHEHVVATLARRLMHGVTPPDLAGLTAEQFWPAMADFLTSLGRSAGDHPESRLLGEMFHQGRDLDNGCRHLQQTRDSVSDWLAGAVRRGRDLGVVRADIPTELLIQLTVTVLHCLDRWALSNEPHPPDGPFDGETPLRLVRDLIAAREHDGTGPGVGP